MTEKTNETSQQRQVVIVGEDGRPVGQIAVDEDGKNTGPSVADMVEQPAKVMRIGTMIK